MPEKKRSITIDDLWAMKRFGAPAISPDGRWVCVAVTRYSMKDNKGTSQLWLLSTDGKEQRQLTRGKADSEPRWSPDGSSIAFVSKRVAERGEKDKPEVAHLYRIRLDGGEAEQLTHIETGASGHRWFPDGKRIAFISWVWPGLKGEKAQSLRMEKEREDKVKATVIERNDYRYWDHWLPRGREAHLFVCDCKSGKSRDLFEGTPYHLPPQEPGVHSYDIAPDGRDIAFHYDTDPDPMAPSSTDIFVMHVASGKARNLTEKTGRSDEHPVYSPDGRWLAFLSTDLERAHNEQARIGLIDLKTGALRPLTFGWDRGVNAPLRFAPDGSALYFSAETEEIQPLWRIGLKDKTPTEIRRGPGHGGVAGEPAVAAEVGTLAYVRSSLTQPPKVYAAAADGSDERAIETFNDALVGQLKFGTTESLSVKGFGGDPIQMWVVTPPNFDAKKKWPLLHSIHGGPHTCSNDAWHWRWNAALFAAHGYVVALVNYHGSTGWGQKFVESINGDWGRRELADVEAGTDALVKRGSIDTKRMVATGGSYGGYMVAYMNGHLPASRYRAYVCHAGCFDWVAMMGADGYGWFARELGAFPWDDEARVLNQSPHHFAQAMNTPTLVLHGELDYRVPYYQGLAYYNTLRARKVPARLVFFPDENHWILKPQNSRLWYKEFFDWCERFTARK